MSSSQKRIDIVAWKGDQAAIGEAKVRVTPYALGQLQTYRHLWLEDHPNAKAPLLFVVAAYGDADSIRVLNAYGVDVFLYPDADLSAGSPDVGVSPGDGAPA